MRKLIIISLIFNIFICYSQNVTEVPKPENLEFIDSLFNEVKIKRDSGFYTVINILENGLKHANTNFEVYKITFNLGFLYTRTEQYNKCIDMWLSANKSGICYDFQFDENLDPPYLKSYEDNKQFLDFIKKNDALLLEQSKNAKAEYFVNLPTGYDSSVNYPLLIVLHGGVGNFYRTYENWQSEKIETDFITVYPQGRIMKGSFSRSYGNEGIEDITEVYKQVVKTYSVDTTSILLAGQSAGGALSLGLVENKIAAKGLLLAFPVKPGNFDISSAQNLKNSLIRVYTICGEKDKYFYPGQLELSKLMDSAQVENMFIKYPELGHNFPEDFKLQIDNGIKYILDY